MPGQRNHATYMGGTRSKNLTTPLGSACHELGITAKALCIGTGINPRTLSDYLSNRLPIRTHHLPLISSFLGVPPSRLIGEPEGGYDGELRKVINRSNGSQTGRDGGKARDRDLREERLKPEGVMRIVNK